MDVTSQFPHLERAMGFGPTHPGKGNCFQRSAALMLDMNRRAELVFGVVRAATPEERQAQPNASEVPFIHAWVEVGSDVWAPTLIERMGGRLRPTPKDVYYKTNGVTRTWRLSHDAFMTVAKRLKLSSALKHGKARARSGDVTDALLTAAGVRYKVSEFNSALPID